MQREKERKLHMQLVPQRTLQVSTLRSGTCQPIGNNLLADSVVVLTAMQL